MRVAPSCQRQIDHRLDARDIGAMHHHVDGERQAELHDLGGERTLARRGAFVAGDVVGGGFLAVLDRDLHVVEPAVGEHAQGLRRQADRRGDEIAVEAGVARGRDDLGQIAPRRRLAARQMHLQHAEPGRFAEHTRPGRGVELVGARVERDRVGAIRTAERTTMRQLGQQAEGSGNGFRRAELVHHPNSSSLFSASPASSFTTSS